MDLFVHVLAFNGYLVKKFGEREVNNFFFNFISSFVGWQAGSFGFACLVGWLILVF